MMSIYSDGLSEKEKEQFISGFLSAVSAVYDFDVDIKTPCPWCAPWEWCDGWEYPYFSYYDRGRFFAMEHEDDIKEAFTKSDI